MRKLISSINIKRVKNISILSLLLVTGVFLKGCKSSTETKPVEVLKETKVIDYSKTPEEIANFYTEQGLKSIKENFGENEDSLNLALLNLGKPALDIKAKTYEGEDFKLSDLKGKKIALNIVRADCPVCQAEIPLIDKIIEENDDMVVVSVFYRNVKEEIDEYYKNGNSNTNKLILTSEGFDAKTFINYYNLKAVPSIVFIDEDFKVSSIYSGEISMNKFILLKDTAYKKGLYKNIK